MGDLMRYRPGSWTLLARAGSWLLIDVSTDDGLGARLWESLGERPDGRTVLAELLTSYSPFDLPGFAFAARTPEGVEVSVRFPAQITCDNTLVSPDEGSPWVTTRMTGERLVLSGPEPGSADQGMLPLGIGLVPAALLVVELSPTATSPADETLAPESDSSTTEPAPTSSEPTETDPDEAAAATPGEFVRLLQGGGAPESAPEARPEPVVPVIPESSNATDVTDAPDAATPDETAPPSSEHTWIWSGQEAPPDLPPVAAPAPPASPDPVQEAAIAEAAEAASAPDTDVREPDSAAGDPSEVEPAEQTVLAATCAAGHWTPAFAPLCRVCRESVPAQPAVAIPRPNLGVLRLDNGDTIDLERGAVLGRAPNAPRGGSERPHLINLAAYGRDISRIHAEIVLDGWNVLVRDLGSANGTVIHLPGQRPQPLVPHELHELEPGGSIEIAEVTTIRFEPTNGA